MRSGSPTLNNSKYHHTPATSGLVDSYQTQLSNYEDKVSTLKVELDYERQRYFALNNVLKKQERLVGTLKEENERLNARCGKLSKTITRNEGSSKVLASPQLFDQMEALKEENEHLRSTVAMLRKTIEDVSEERGLMSEAKNKNNNTSASDGDGVAKGEDGDAIRSWDDAGGHSNSATDNEKSVPSLQRPTASSVGKKSSKADNMLKKLMAVSDRSTEGCTPAEARYFKARIVELQQKLEASDADRALKTYQLKRLQRGDAAKAEHTTKPPHNKSNEALLDEMRSTRRRAHFAAGIGKDGNASDSGQSGARFSTSPYGRVQSGSEYTSVSASDGDVTHRSATQAERQRAAVPSLTRKLMRHKAMLENYSSYRTASARTSSTQYSARYYGY